MLSDEEKKVIEIVNEIKDIRGMRQDVDGENEDLWALDTLINLIKKQSKEIEELNKENLEIRDWKYVIDSPIDLDKLKELDLIKIKGKEYVSKDKIKAKIEEVQKRLKEETRTDFLIILKILENELQSLLEKE